MNRHLKVHEKQNKRNVDDLDKYELKFIEPIQIILPAHCNPIQTNMNDNHLFDETPWKNFYDELMIKPKDTLGDVNPHYQIIAIILPNGEGDPS